MDHPILNTLQFDISFSKNPIGLIFEKLAASFVLAELASSPTAVWTTREVGPPFCTPDTGRTVSWLPPFAEFAPAVLHSGIRVVDDTIKPTVHTQEAKKPES